MPSRSPDHCRQTSVRLSPDCYAKIAELRAWTGLDSTARVVELAIRRLHAQETRTFAPERERDES